MVERIADGRSGCVEWVSLARVGGVRRGAFTCDAAKRLGNKRTHLIRASEPGIIDDPKTTILLPRKTAQEVVFGIDIKPQGL